MSEPERAGTPDAAEGRGRSGVALALVLALAMAAAWAGLRLASGDAIVAPRWLTDRIEARAAAALGTPGRLSIGAIAATLGEGYVPRLVVRDIALRDAVGAEIGEVPEIRARFAPELLAGGELKLTRLTVVGAALVVRRAEDGRFDVALGGAGRSAAGSPQSGGSRRPRTAPELIGAVDRVFARPLLSALDTVAGEGLRLTFQDARTGRVWRAEGGTLSLRQAEGRRSAALGFSLAGGTAGAPASVRLSAEAPRGALGLAATAEVRGIAARDLAQQLPALSFLAAADAPLSASLTGRLGETGALDAFAGTLEIGRGAIDPGGGARAIPFDGATAALAYDPAAARIDFTELSARTPEARFSATGKALLRDVDPGTGLPGRLVVQLALSDIEFNPAGELSEPARFGSGAAEFRLTPAPFRIELGQLSMTAPGTRFAARGAAAAEAGGWRGALDISADRIGHDRLLALWPLRAVPKTRAWLAENVLAGTLSDLKAALRVAPGSPPAASASFAYDGASVRFLKTLPPITGGRGRASIEHKRFALAMAEGGVTMPGAGRIEAGGSTFVLPDITQKPVEAEIALSTRSGLGAALALLDEKPFEFLRKAGRTPDLAEGRAEVETRLSLPLKKKVLPAEVDFESAGRLTGVRSETLVKNRVLTAPELTLKADPARLAISGAGRIGAAAFDARFTLPIGPGPGPGPGGGGRGAGRVAGTVTLDEAFLEEFDIALPPGMVSGSGTGRIELTLAKDTPPAFTLRSDLGGIAVAIPALNWSKPAKTAGTFEVAGALGAPARIDRLALDAPGLTAAGRIELGADGRLAAARFDRVRAGQWLDAPVTLTPRGIGQAPAVAIPSGTIDLRRTEFAKGGGQGGPITLALDRLVVSDGIVLTGLAAELTTQGGLSGRFAGRLGGQAPVTGVLAPSRDGTAVRLQAADAGAVLRSSGILESARRGTLDLTLVPLAGEGRYDGRVTIRDLGLRGAPALADLLSAVSVVGLLEQLNGQGITFGEVTGEFTLEPRGITLRRGSAVGPSLGVSMAGIYDLRSKRIDMQGTISPIYLINGIGQIFTRRGEGLFGFNYRMAGPASAPQTSVNPLSILTPGMFREIFRAAPPSLGQ